jgi:outer membrane protein, multidrug efflux system
VIKPSANAPQTQARSATARLVCTSTTSGAPLAGRSALGGAALCLTFQLAGCANVPDVAPALMPSSSMVGAWQAPAPKSTPLTSGPVTDLSTWWAGFNDPLLPPLIAAAQQVSPSLASASARIERARASRVAAGAALAPRVDAVGSANQGRQVPKTPSSTSLGGALQASWELDLFGGNAAGRDATQARLAAAQAAWHDTHISIAAEVATSYTALRACEAQLVQSRLDADSRAETSRLTELSARAGFTAPADAALARAGAAQARSQAISQRASCDNLVKSLVELSDIAEADLRQRLAGKDGANTAQLPKPQAIAPVALPAALLAQRPDLAESARFVEAAAAERVQTQMRERPQVSLAGSLGGLSLRSNGTTTTGATWSFGPVQVSFPIFDAGARAANTTAARAAYDEAVAVYQAQVRRAVREVETSLVNLQASAEREADALLAAKDFEVSLRATQQRQKGGLASLFELETSRRNAVSAQSALIELQRERATAWISLYRALGGGWDSSKLVSMATTGTPTAAPVATASKP